MNYRSHPAPGPLLFGYDPFWDLPADHLARWIEFLVEETVAIVPLPAGKGQPAYDPRLCLKVLLYGYATGTRSSRQLERLCRESLPYLYLTRGEAPSHMTLCRFRTDQKELLEKVWEGLFGVAAAMRIQRIGHIVVDSTKLRADVSPEAIVKAKEYSAVLAELETILEEAKRVDERESQEGYDGETRLGQEPQRETMRSILRRIRKRRAQEKAAQEKAAQEKAAQEKGQSPSIDGKPIDAASEVAAARIVTPRMKKRIKAAVKVLKGALNEAKPPKYLAITDPDAPMMAEGREKGTRPCHSLEVAVDCGEGLLVVGQTTQDGNDNARLELLVEAAQTHEPEGVHAVDGDSGYYEGGAVGRLETSGIDTCVPDSQTACDLHRGLPIGTTRSTWISSVPMVYEPETDAYRCPEGNRLLFSQNRRESGMRVAVYIAERSCQGCPLASACIRGKGERRHLHVSEYGDLLKDAREQFAEPAHQERYHHRGNTVETVFGFMKGVLGFRRWSLRGKRKIACEGRLMTLAYQIRKMKSLRRPTEDPSLPHPERHGRRDASLEPIPGRSAMQLELLPKAAAAPEGESRVGICVLRRRTRRFASRLWTSVRSSLVYCPLCPIL